MKLGHANKAGVRIRHRPVPVAPHQFAYADVFFVKIETHTEKSHLNEAKEIVGLMAIALQEEERFGDDRFASEHNRRRFLALLDSPGVRVIVADKKRDQRARVDDPLRHRP
jgi:hypothetical protein